MVLYLSIINLNALRFAHELGHVHQARTLLRTLKVGVGRQFSQLRTALHKTIGAVHHLALKNHDNNVRGTTLFDNVRAICCSKYQ